MRRHFPFPAVPLALFLALAPALVRATPGHGDAKPDPCGLKVRVVTTSLDPQLEAPDWAVVGPDGDAVDVSLVPWNISPPVSQGDTRKISLYPGELLKKALEEKKEPPAPVLCVDVPKGADHCLLVVRPHPERKECWEGKVYNDSVEEYPGGSRLFFNLTPYALSGSLGKAEFQIPPNGERLVDPKVRSEDFREVVKVFASLPKRRATVLDEQWAFFPESRGVILVFEAPGGAIRLVGIPDEVPADQCPPAEPAPSS